MQIPAGAPQLAIQYYTIKVYHRITFKEIGRIVREIDSTPKVIRYLAKLLWVRGLSGSPSRDGTCSVVQSILHALGWDASLRGMLVGL